MWLEDPAVVKPNIIDRVPSWWLFHLFTRPWKVTLFEAVVEDTVTCAGSFGPGLSLLLLKSLIKCLVVLLTHGVSYPSKGDYI